MAIDDARPPDPPRRDAEDPPAPVPRGQLLRRPQAGHARARPSSATAARSRSAQTATPVQLDQVLRRSTERHARQPAGRSCEQLGERARRRRGARRSTRRSPRWAPALQGRRSALAQAARGTQPGDLSRLDRRRRSASSRRCAEPRRSSPSLISSFERDGRARSRRAARSCGQSLRGLSARSTRPRRRSTRRQRALPGARGVRPRRARPRLRARAQDAATWPHRCCAQLDALRRARELPALLDVTLRPGRRVAARRSSRR